MSQLLFVEGLNFLSKLNKNLEF